MSRAPDEQADQPDMMLDALPARQPQGLPVVVTWPPKWTTKRRYGADCTYGQKLTVDPATGTVVPWRPGQPFVGTCIEPRVKAGSDGGVLLEEIPSGPSAD